MMLVQASIEQSFDGILSALEDCRIGSSTLGFTGQARGTIFAGDELATLADKEFERMHLLGVRCIRLHGSYGGSGNSLEWAQWHLKAMAQLPPVLKYGWSISAQLPLEIWSELKSYILTDPLLSHVTIVADHVACATPAAYRSNALADFLDLLRSGRVYVKISALHRRSPGNIEAMKPILTFLARGAPHALLWGSDWPHVNTSHNNYEEGPLDIADASHELEVVKTWFSDKVQQQMLVENPQRLFGT
ncbi:hypothetical protein ACEQ8H_008629 [Pleosporales sp. CAS-2024a]